MKKTGLLLRIVLLCLAGLATACTGPAGTSPELPVPGVPPSDPTEELPLPPPAAAVPASALAARLGKPARLLVGLGTQPASAIQAQGLLPDFFDQYLVGVGPGSWRDWNAPAGAYVAKVAADADALGAVPMFTLYQMAHNGDGNLWGINDAGFMAQYWSNVTLLFQQLAAYGRPAVVNFEPDFWGYAQRQAPGGDPARLPARVSLNPDCAALPNNVTGIAQCLLLSARRHAPLAVVGFPVSDWGADRVSDLVRFMNQIGAHTADVAIVQTLDRDAGCFEVQAPNCQRSGSGWYWDESNRRHPSFNDHFAYVRAVHEGLGLPALWWQTPMGVPMALPAVAGRYRDNRVQYFLSHPQQLVDAGGVGVVFSPGATGQTDITSDGGQFRRLSAQYLANPVALH